MVAANNRPLPEAQDQQSGPSEPSALERSQTAATNKILEENRTTTENKSTTTESGALGVNDGSDSDTPGLETPAERMLMEVETARKAASETGGAAAKLEAAGISPELAKEFGNLEVFDPADAPEGGGAEQVSAAITEAKVEEAATNPTDQADEAGEHTDSSTEGTALHDLTSWAADSFNKYVAEPVSAAMSDISSAFDDAVKWFGQSDTFVAAKGPIAGMNNKNDEFRAAENQAARNNRFNLNGAQDQSGGEGLKLPDNAERTGTVEIGGNQVSVFKTPEGDTYLKNGDRVIGRQKPDGSYGLSLQDGSQLDFKLSEGKDGKYKLDSLERTKDGQLQQKIADGVLFNYNYDAQGNRTSVDAAGDLKGPLSPERLDAIKKELGDSGAAALRVTGEDGKTQRLLMQTHDKDTSSLTDIDQKRAQIFHDGKEYRLNEKDQLGVVDSNGEWQAPESTESTDESQNPESQEESQDPSRREQVERLRAEQKRLADLARRVRNRAEGTSDDAVDGVRLGVDATTGDATVTRENPAGGQPLTTTEIPAGKDKPITVINSAGEKTEIKGDNFDVKTKDGERLFDFNTETGLKTENMLVDRDGMTDLDSGASVNPDGDFLDSNGDYIGGDSEEFFGEDCEDCVETKENQAVSKTASADLIKLCSSITMSIASGNSQAALSLGVGGLAKGFGALAEVGNDLYAQAPILNALNNLRSTMANASQTNPQADATQMSDFRNVASPSSSTFTPPEFGRRLRVVA